jgi:intracellular sulfur oxidation DsrE/DsrF family protein
MRQPLAVAAHHFRFKLVAATLISGVTLRANAVGSLLLSLGLLMLLSTHALAQSGPRYLANIELHTTAELFDVLQRSEMLFDDGELAQQSPVAIVLHGAEARAFLRKDYSQNKSLVNLAAKLTALGAVDIQVCEVWMGSQSLDAKKLQPFVGIVTYGPSEIRRLVAEENYIYF